MKTVRALLYRDVVWSVVFVALAFMSLFFFIDFLDQLEDVGRNGFTVWAAGLSALLDQIDLRAAVEMAKAELRRSER